jgi:beta-glucosidase
MNAQSDPARAESWRDSSKSSEDRARGLLAAMTLEEKAAQLGSFWDRPTSKGDTAPGTDGQAPPDVAPLQEAFDQAWLPLEQAVRDGIGQLTRVYGTAPVTPAEGAAKLRAAQRAVTGASRFGIPAIAHEECLTGLTAYGATVYPSPIAWGATWDRPLVERMATQIGLDMSALGVHQGLAPLMDVVRDYRWGRVEESIGEDPYLVGTIGTAYVQGLQETGIVATLKHFAGYPASRGGRNHAPVSIGPREFSDIILWPFEMAVRVGGAKSIMNSYSDIDGSPAAGSSALLTDLLRDTWGFEGTVVSDYWAIAFLDMMHRVTADRADSGALALNAGMDVELPNADAYRHLPAMVRHGQVEEATIDRSTLRVLTQKAALGLLDGGWEPPNSEDIVLDPPENRLLARQVARESVILLANDGLLPIDPSSAQTVAVIGPTSGSARSLLGCYSFPNHVLVHKSDADLGISVPTLVDALGEALPHARLLHEQGVPIVEPDASGVDAAASAAANADLAIVAVGDLGAMFGRGTSGEGCDAADLRLPGLQGELVDAVLATGTPTVLVVISGRPYALGAYAERCGGIVQAFLPGEEGAAALAEVLTGTVNPSGHLPVCIPKHPGGQPHTYLAPPLGHASNGISNLDPTPLYPFGHGLSYTTFSYRAMSLSSRTLPTDGTLTATVRIANTGDRSGTEVMQLYLTDEVAQVTRPVKSLIGYARVDLDAGREADVQFTVHAERTAFTGVDLERVVEPGWIQLSVGPSSAQLPLSARVELTGPLRQVRRPVLDTPSRVKLSPAGPAEQQIPTKPQ